MTVREEAGLGLRGRVLRSMAVLTTVGMLSVLSVGVAVADSAPPVGTPATVTADQLPTWQVNGVVWSQVVVGNTVYVAGSFTKARPPGVAVGGAGEVAANNVFAYDVRTGNRVASFSHQLNGQANVVAASPDGSRVYVGGDFTTVDGVSRSHIAAFSTATNALDLSFAPAVSARVGAFAVTATTVYAGGWFTGVVVAGKAQSRKYLAAFNATSGALLPWAPVAAGGTVSAMTMTPDGSRVIAAGSFTTLNGVAAYGMGSLDAVSGATMPWAANLRIRDAGPNGAIGSLRADASQVYGTGWAFGSGATFEGTFAADPMTGKIIWVNDCLGDTYDAFPVGQVLYSVSHAHNCHSIGAFPEVTPRVNHHALAFTTYPTGTNTGPDPYGWNYSGLPDSSLLQWYPDLAIGSFTGQNQAAWSVSGNSSYVVLGGEFPQVNGVNQQGLVRFAVSSIAPNLKGPRTLATMTPTATSPSAGTARVTWQATWDQDNQYLTYNVYRDGGSTPAYTTTQASNFWQMPTMSFLDTGLSPGSKHSYVVKVSDPFKNIRTSPVSNTVTMSGTAPANQPPVASIALPSCVQLVCSFDGSGSTDPDGTIVSYGWAFGDGVVGNGATLSHTYASAGTYAVSLTVTDNSGATATKSISVTVTGTPSTLYAQDSFARTVANGWGSANLGGAWSASGSAYTVAAGVGATALATAGSGASTFLNGVSKSDTDVQVSVTTDKAPTGGGIYVYVIGRRITGQGDYRAKVQLVSSGAVKVSLTRTSSTGVETDLTSATVAGLTYVPGTSLRVRLQVTGTGPTSLRAKVWVAGTTEPAAWAVSATDATAGLQAAGSVGVGDYLSGSATNAPVVVRFDDFQAGPTH